MTHGLLFQHMYHERTESQEWTLSHGLDEDSARLSGRATVVGDSLGEIFDWCVAHSGPSDAVHGNGKGQRVGCRLLLIPTGVGSSSGIIPQY